MTVYLVALGADRFEIYSEPPEDAPSSVDAAAGRFKRWGQQAAIRWRDLVDTARRGEATGRFAKWRDSVVCHLAESIAEQRTLWALRKADAATLRYPASLTPQVARRRLDGILTASRWHHGVWFVVDGVVFAASAVLAPIPGPNAIAYYLAFRLFGHGQSCLGAHRGLNRVVWGLAADEHLAELATLVRVPHATRASRVAEIARLLTLQRFAAYFERVAR